VRSRGFHPVWLGERIGTRGEHKAGSDRAPSERDRETSGKAGVRWASRRR
jgi:hypothetical protein